MKNKKSSTLQKLSFLDVVRFASRYWIKQPFLLFVILAGFLTAALIETYLPTALEALLTAIRHQETHQKILYVLAIFLGAYLSQAVLFSLIYLVYNFFENKIFKALVDDVFSHVYLLPEHFFANTFTGSIISKIYRARQKIEVFEDQILGQIFPTAIILLGSLFFLFWRFPFLAILIFIYLIIFVIVSFILVFHVSGPAQGRYAEAQDYFNAHLADSITSIAPTKAYANERFEITRLKRITELLRIKNLHAYYLGNMSALIQRLMLAGMLALLMGGGVWYFFQGKATMENMAYLAFAYTIIQSYVGNVGENIKNLLTSSYDLHGVIQLLKTTPEVPLTTHLPDLSISQGKIHFENVTFTYPGKSSPIFSNLSVHIKAGERIALVGHSGGGKTTFVRLLQYLYPIQEGHILIDNQDVTLGSRESLRRAIALVPQEPILFHRSLRENIAYAKQEATFAEIRAAAQKAHIEDFILSLPEQYDTLVGERGVKLSGGERQRIAIARAMLADRPILILDEATSALDSENERAIQTALRSLTHGRTSIMIAHRLSTILDADRILVFDAGKIVEEGTHPQLIQKNGIYAHFFKLQSGGFIVD